MSLPAYTMGQVNLLDFSPIENALGRAMKQKQLERDYALQQQRMAMDQQRLGFEESRLGFEREAARRAQELFPDQQRQLRAGTAHTEQQTAGLREDQKFKGVLRPYQEEEAWLTNQARRKAIEEPKSGVWKDGDIPWVRDPSVPGGYRYPVLPDNSRRKLSPAEQKEIFEADDTVMQTQLVLNDLKKVLQLHDKAYDGTLARERAMTMNRVPFGAGQTPEALATEQLHNLITNQVLTSLKTTFGGNPTEGEREILIKVQGSVNQPAAVRKEIFARAQELAAARLAYNRQKAAALRAGNYLKPGYEVTPPSQQPAPPPPDPKQIPTITNPDEARKFGKGQRFIYNGQEYEVQ